MCLYFPPYRCNDCGQMSCGSNETMTAHCHVESLKPGIKVSSELKYSKMQDGQVLYSDVLSRINKINSFCYEL